MKIFRIKHNIEAFLPFFQEEAERRFTDLMKANQVFESIAEKIDYSKDEWIALYVIEIRNQE